MVGALVDPVVLVGDVIVVGVLVDPVVLVGSVVFVAVARFVAVATLVGDGVLVDCTSVDVGVGLATVVVGWLVEVAVPCGVSVDVVLVAAVEVRVGPVVSVG